MSHTSHRYFVLNKPLNMVSQFVSSHDVNLLGAIDFQFPEGTHAIGRLDNDSEGLLLLTTNKKVTKLLFESAQPHTRVYLVQVKDIVSPGTLAQLQSGVTFPIKGNVLYTTGPCDVAIVPKPAYVWDTGKDHGAAIPHTWLTIALTEGKFHQVRKMVRTVRHRCKRLIRISIEDIELGDLAPGAIREMEETEFFRLLKITDWA